LARYREEHTKRFLAELLVPWSLHGKLKREQSMAYLEGQLRGDVVGAGDEHTGYVLEVEVDMSAVQNAREIVNEHVAVTGEVVIVDYPERGKVLIFRVTSAAAIEEEPEEMEETE
jgi:hypothetical protein